MDFDRPLEQPLVESVVATDILIDVRAPVLPKQSTLSFEIRMDIREAQGPKPIVFRPDVQAEIRHPVRTQPVSLLAELHLDIREEEIPPGTVRFFGDTSVSIQPPAAPLTADVLLNIVTNGSPTYFETDGHWDVRHPAGYQPFQWRADTTLDVQGEPKIRPLPRIYDLLIRVEQEPTQTEPAQRLTFPDIQLTIQKETEPSAVLLESDIRISIQQTQTPTLFDSDLKLHVGTNHVQSAETLCRIYQQRIQESDTTLNVFRSFQRLSETRWSITGGILHLIDTLIRVREEHHYRAETQWAIKAAVAENSDLLLDMRWPQIRLAHTLLTVFNQRFVQTDTAFEVERVAPIQYFDGRYTVFAVVRQEDHIIDVGDPAC